MPRPDRQFYAQTQAFGRFGIRWFDPQIMPQEHFHGHIELNWLTDGSMDYVIDGRPVQVPSQRLVMFWAGIPHQTVGLDTGDSGREPPVQRLPAARQLPAHATTWASSPRP